MAAPLNDCILCICNYDLKELYITIFLYLLMILVYLYMYYLKYIVLYINIYLWALNPSPKKETGNEYLNSRGMKPYKHWLHSLYIYILCII